MFNYTFPAVLIEQETSWRNLSSAFDEQLAVFNALLELPSNQVLEAATMHMDRCEAGVVAASEAREVCRQTQFKLQKLRSLAAKNNKPDLMRTADEQLLKVNELCTSLKTKAMMALSHAAVARRLYKQELKLDRAHPDKAFRSIQNAIQAATRHIGRVSDEHGLWWPHRKAVIDQFLSRCRSCTEHNLPLERIEFLGEGQIHFEFTDEVSFGETDSPVQVMPPYSADQSSDCTEDFASVVFRVMTHDPATSPGHALVLVAVPKTFFPALDLGVRDFRLTSRVSRGERELFVHLTFASNAVNPPVYASDLVELLPLRYAAHRATDKDFAKDSLDAEGVGQQLAY